MDLNYISIRINFNDFEENSAALCILKSCPNLQEIEMLVSDLLCAYVKFYVGCIVIFFKKNCLTSLYPMPLRGETTSFWYLASMQGRPEEQADVEPQTGFWGDDQWKCLFGQLRLVKIVGISGIRSELDCIKFLLSNSPVLEQMTVKPASIEGGWELVKELLRFRRASTQAEVIYLEP